MPDPSARLLQLLGIMMIPREWSATDLAGRLGVTPRTVRSDIARLRNLGYPVNATRGRSGGYRLAAGAELPPLMLDDDEGVAVAIGLGLAVSGVLPGIEQAALSALAKVEQVMPNKLRSRIASLRLHLTRIPHDHPEPHVSLDHLEALARACAAGEVVRFDYRSHDGTASERRAEPHHVVSWGRRWYLVGWDRERGDWRTYRVDRIVALVVTGFRFEARDLGESVTEYVARGASSAAWRHRADIRIDAPASAVLERVNPAVGMVEVIDEHTSVLHTGADSIETLAVYVGMLGLDFTVDGPSELLDRLAELSDRYARAIQAPA